MSITRFAVLTLLLSGAALAQRQAVQPKEFPTGRPFSPGVWAGDIFFVAGQIGSDLKTSKIPDNFEDEVKTCLNNIGVILKEAGLSFDDVVTVNVYLTDLALFPQLNAAYVPFFREPRPARTTVGVASLVGTAKVEITVTAHRKPAKK